MRSRGRRERKRAERRIEDPDYTGRAPRADGVAVAVPRTVKRSRGGTRGVTDRPGCRRDLGC